MNYSCVYETVENIISDKITRNDIKFSFFSEANLKIIRFILLMTNDTTHSLCYTRGKTISSFPSNLVLSLNKS